MSIRRRRGPRPTLRAGRSILRRPAGVLITAAALLAGTGGPVLAGPAGGGAAPAGAVLATVQVPVPRGVKVTDSHVDVLLPPGYYLSGDRRYPVLYLLHGAGDDYRSWSARTDLVAYEQAHAFPVIIVMPDGGKNSVAGWYSDWRDGRYQWETYDTSILPRYIDGHFRTIPSDRGIAGLSMGGFGALSYAGRHPGTYRVAASFSGAVDMLYGAPATGVIFDQLHSQYGTPNDEVWGNQQSDEAVWAEHNPASLASRLKGVRILLASGTGTPGGAGGDDPTDPGAYGLENGVFQMNQSLVRALDQAGVAHTDDFYAGGYHGWPYWQADLHWALPQIVAALGPARP